jgi:ubiquinone/menaquinone biosynthesis C-methylase UbiE
MPFQDEYFDKVIFLESFNSFKDEKRVLKEIVRVLKNSGQLLIKENDCNCMSYKVESIKSIIRGEYCKYYNSNELSSMLKGFGLEGTVENVNKKMYIYLGTKIS